MQSITVVIVCRNPYNIECLAPYGGPVEPQIALGAFAEYEANTDPDYKLATGITLTFLVNNQQNKSLLGPAMKWEKRFVEFLKDYSNPMFDFAFSAERSIEDGIDEISSAEIPTVVISYAVMFIYITIALGKIRRVSSFFVSHCHFISTFSSLPNNFYRLFSS